MVGLHGLCKGLVVLASAVGLVAVLFVIVSHMVQLFANVADTIPVALLSALLGSSLSQYSSKQYLFLPVSLSTK
jgi:hypothetical protein